MHDYGKTLLLCGVLAMPIGAVAQTPAPPAPALKVGKMLTSSDGRRLGRIEELDKGSDGTPVTVELFSDGAVLYVPVATISPANAGFVTSMTYADVMKGK